jgi:hypothetical protein
MERAHLMGRLEAAHEVPDSERKQRFGLVQTWKGNE